jgi:hypothetical protein
MRQGEVTSKATARFEELLDRLREKWPALVRPVQELQSAQFKLEHKDLTWGPATSADFGRFADVATPDAGEIFAVAGGLLVVSLTRQRAGGRVEFRTDGEGNLVPTSKRQGPRLVVSANALTHEGAAGLLDEVTALATEVLGVTMDVWKYPSAAFDAIRKEAVTEDLPGDAEYLRVARAVLDRSARTLAVAVKSSRGLLARDAQRHVAEGVDPKKALEALVNAGVVSRDVVVVCTSSGAQVARVPDEESLDALASAGLRCACGKPINEELPERLYTTTSTGALLLDKSRWMSILVRQKLVEIGVPEEDILLECQVGSDEIDCVALVSGELAILELKDKEFSVGNAYSFGAKISILNPAHAVVVTTESVASDVKSHFNRTRASERGGRYGAAANDRQLLHYVEGAHFLDELEPFVEAVFIKDGKRMLDAALALGVARSESIVSALETRRLDLK